MNIFWTLTAVIYMKILIWAIWVFFQQFEEWRLVRSLRKNKNAQLQDELEFEPEITSEWPEE